MHDVRQALEVAAKATLTLDESLDASSSMFQLYQALRAFNQAYSSDNTQYVKSSWYESMSGICLF